jgi:hypothetical protein
MVIDESRVALFRLWLDRMEDVVGHKVELAEAARLLGKSDRMIRYYDEGREIPRDTRMLMDALLQGFKPRPWSKK